MGHEVGQRMRVHVMTPLILHECEPHRLELQTKGRPLESFATIIAQTREVMRTKGRSDESQDDNDRRPAVGAGEAGVLVSRNWVSAGGGLPRPPPPHPPRPPPPAPAPRMDNTRARNEP